MLKKIVSFGFRHGDTPDRVASGSVVVDVRRMFKNPYFQPALRDKRGTDPEVGEFIVSETPSFGAKYAYVRDRITAPGIEVAYIGCLGGKHRSVYLAERLGAELRVEVEHRDIAKEG
jgi:UPF0042 nucleotide-binding protein